LLPLFFVFHSYAENFPLISGKSAVLLFGTYSASFLLFALLGYLISKNWRKSAVYTVMVMCSFFFFGSFHDLLKIAFGNSIIIKYTFLIPVLFVLYFVVYYLMKKSKATYQKLVGYLNIVLAILIVIDLGKLFLFQKPNVDAEALHLSYNKHDNWEKPDIFFIIADEYIGNKTLKKHFAYDNSAFEKELRTRGFHIVSNSKSNYNYTPYSVASILSLNYLKGISTRSNDPKNRNITYKVINQNTLTDFLSSLGYTFVNHSLFDLANQPTEVNSMFFLTKEKLITHQTLLGRLDRDVRFNLVTRFKIDTEIKRLLLSTLENNKKLLNDTYATINTKAKRPKFVYTHLMMPHYPYYFDRNGRPYPFDSIMEGKQVDKRQYIEYLQYCNRSFLTLLDTILKNYQKPPIIIFMGDHGFRHFTEPVDKEYQFHNLNAIYLPSRDYGDFYDSISAVNQFRVILNTQFKQKFPLIKDSTIYLKEY
jgi:hypothetical protein